MTISTIGRAIWLALFLTFSSFNWAAAHGLPRSVLMFAETDAVHLTITLPLEDLAIAETSFAPLMDHPLDTPLSGPDLAVLTTYFIDHLIIEQNNSPVANTLDSAILEQAFDEHLGHYTLLILSFETSSLDASASFLLTYDAIMHEVRNHRAQVVWSLPDAAPYPIADFGYRPTNGAQRPVEILPPR